MSQAVELPEDVTTCTWPNYLTSAGERGAVADYHGTRDSGGDRRGRPRYHRPRSRPGGLRPPWVRPGWWCRKARGRTPAGELGLKPASAHPSGCRRSVARGAHSLAGASGSRARWPACPRQWRRWRSRYLRCPARGRPWAPACQLQRIMSRSSPGRCRSGYRLLARQGRRSKSRSTMSTVVDTVGAIPCPGPGGRSAQEACSSGSHAPSDEDAGQARPVGPRQAAPTGPDRTALATHGPWPELIARPVGSFCTYWADALSGRSGDERVRGYGQQTWRPTTKVSCLDSSPASYLTRHAQPGSVQRQRLGTSREVPAKLRQPPGGVEGHGVLWPLACWRTVTAQSARPCFSR